MTAKSWLTMTMLKPYSRCKSASSFRICRCHCTSNALVGSSNTSTRRFDNQGAGDGKPLPLAA